MIQTQSQNEAHVLLRIRHT